MILQSYVLSKLQTSTINGTERSFYLKSDDEIIKFTDHLSFQLDDEDEVYWQWNILDRTNAIVETIPSRFGPPDYHKMNRDTVLIIQYNHMFFSNYQAVTICVITTVSKGPKHPPQHLTRKVRMDAYTLTEPIMGPDGNIMCLIFEHLRSWGQRGGSIGVLSFPSLKEWLKKLSR